MPPSRIKMMLTGAAGCALICLVFSTARAAEPAASAPGGPPHGPPPEAIAACKGKAEGATVTFTGRGGESLTGTCQTNNGVLAARPAGMGQHPPPQR